MHLLPPATCHCYLPLLLATATDVASTPFNSVINTCCRAINCTLMLTDMDMKHGNGYGGDLVGYVVRNATHCLSVCLSDCRSAHLTLCYCPLFISAMSNCIWMSCNLICHGMEQGGRRDQLLAADQ